MLFIFGPEEAVPRLQGVRSQGRLSTGLGPSSSAEQPLLRLICPLVFLVELRRRGRKWNKHRSGLEKEHWDLTAIPRP